MPQIPQYDANANVQTSQIAPFQNTARQDAANQNKVLGTLQNIAQSWSDAHDTMQYTKKKANYQILVEDINNRSDLDQNLDNKNKYLEELQQAKAESLKGIDNQAIANKLAQELDLSNTINGLKIEHGFKIKELANNQFNVNTWVTSKINEMGGATESERLNIQAEIEEQLQIQITQGVLSPEMAAKILMESKIASASSFIFSDPDEAIKALQDKDGFYKDIPAKKSNELIKSAESYKKRLEVEAAELKQTIRYKNEAILTQKLAKKEIDPLTVSQVTNMVGQGTISEDFGKAYLRVLTSPKSIGGKTKAGKRKLAGFTELASQLFKAETDEEIERSLINLFDETANGNKISQSELEVLLLAADKASKEGKSWISNLGNLGEKIYNMETGRMLYNYLERVIEGKDHDTAKEEAIAEEQMRVNPNRTQYTLGVTYDLPKGMLTVVGYADNGDPKFEKAD